MDAFDSALAITKANGSYSEIFADQLSSGACRPPSLLCTAQPPNHLPLRVHRQCSSPWTVPPIRTSSHSLHAYHTPSWIEYSAAEPSVLSTSQMYVRLAFVLNVRF